MKLEPFHLEPKEFKIPKLAFKVTDLKSFDTKLGVILWCCFKQQCITDQYFDQNIADAVAFYDQNWRDFNNDFLKFRSTTPSGLYIYFKSLSDESLLMIFRLMQNPHLFRYDLDGTVYTLDDNFRKIFKPEEYI